MSIRRTREHRLPRTGELYPDDENDPKRFFGETDGGRKANWKAMQLCKQVERAAAVTLADLWECDSLLGASIAAVEPAPDQARLLVIVVLAPGKEAREATDAKAALLRLAPVFREEAARSIHRKRAPEIVFEVRQAEEGNRA